MTSHEPAPGNPTDPPHSVHSLYIWIGVLGAAAAVLTWILGWYLASGEGKLLGRLLVGLGFAAYLLVQFVRMRARRLQRIEAVLSTSEISSVEDRQAGLRELKAFGRMTLRMIAVLAALVACAATILLFRPAYHAFYVETPSKLPLDSLSYFDIAMHASLLHDAPFVEAVAVFLKDEAKAAGGATQIVIAKAKPLDHPTTPFGVLMEFDTARYQVSGYAFVMRRQGERTTFEPLLVRYTRDGRVSFRVPPCSTDDQVMFIGRMTAQGKQDFLPLETQLNMVVDNKGA